MNEKLIEKNICAFAKKEGGEAYKWWPITITGLPDRIVLLPGARIGFAELKSTGEELKPRQRIVIRFLLKLGFLVAVIDDKASLDLFKSTMLDYAFEKIAIIRKRTQLLLDSY